MNSSETKSEISSQAWRKKPRQFAPKSRLGCKTCKIRRIKCDQARPSCQKCQSTGRTCDGYDVAPHLVEADVKMSQHHHSDAIATATHGLPNSSTAWSVQKTPHPRYQRQQSLILHNPGALMLLPVDSAQAEAMSFFEVISVNHLNEYYPSQSWRETLMFFSQTTPSVRHAAVALSLIHRSYHDSCSSHSEYGALFHYNKAIQLFLSQESGDNIEVMAIALLVCYLFTSFDNLAGKYQRAMIHLQGGVKLSRSITDAMLDSSSVSSANVFLIEVVKQLRRLDMQAGAYLVGWSADNTQETPEQEALFLNNAFDSVEHAADCHQVLIARAMSLHWMAQEASFTAGVPPIASKQLVIEQLETWSHLFEHMLSTTNHHGDIGISRVEKLLRLQNTVLWILVSSLGPGREMEYDKFLPEFQRCVKIVDEVAFGHQRHEGSSKPRFTQDVAIVPILYIIGAKCREPGVRQGVLRILRRQRLREAVWDSAFAARAVERIAEIEQDKIGGGCIETMGEIEVSQRVECVSWEQVINNQGARLELEYTLCKQERRYTESLFVH
ncbi:hypothetical protein FPSE_06091 [Fusarium pseudograminearum CS3096]|uniref:Zn(2)-C6 fungal-type domain-containing protein n=1 Tax=Fusarium pseudograminearum (strain CS3096) TaxID=1028729 RepID=K3W092_FUSPC|nr:hypothetical protein FPSE_06091 [Fusarium pseudograminearum CS3096]EKJ73745.1 hypothetical protein FPSE_06091 [Fusarium pseudograminearum CS3096]